MISGLIIVSFNILFNLNHVLSNDVLGCGGFIKSHVPIDFSKVEVKLYTKQGILKDKTNCAPNNGYYFIPLYDKGDYILQLEPPPGWSFQPMKVDVSVDRKSDACTLGKDINFVFKGFGITGKVENVGTPGKGPSGVTVTLQSDLEEIRTTITGVDGNFFFTPVYPGTYTVYISHPKWKIKKKSVQVKLTVGNTDIPLNSLVIWGYDVKGFIKSDNEPVKDVTIVLFKHDDNKYISEVDGCDTSPLPVLQSDTKPLCHVKSNENGEFIFPTVSCGHYYIMPFYGGQNIHFEPPSISIYVNNESVLLSDYFEIVGFSISGRVLSSHNGNPVSDASVFLDNKKVAITNKDGTYVLEKIKAGTYTLKVTTDDLQFDEKVLKVSPSLSRLPDFIPKEYKVCGRVISENPQSIMISKIGSTFMLSTNSDPGDGVFCEFLGPGKYQIQVTVSSLDHLEGVQFYPVTQIIEVTSKPIGDITFSQLIATVSGKVKCLQESDCSDLKILLRSSINDAEETETVVSNNYYKFNDIRPGRYEIIVNAKKLCWQKDLQYINVNSAIVNVPPFTQTGYAVVFTSTHNAEVLYKQTEHTKSTRFEIRPGRNVHCVEKPGSYNFTLESCHVFDNNNKIAYNTDSDNNEIFLSFQKHLIKILIDSDENYGEVFVDINNGGNIIKKGPLPYSNKKYVLEFHLDSKDTGVVIAPKSNTIFFNPPSIVVDGQPDCVNLGTKFKAIKGLIFEGKITPPLSGVKIKVELDGVEIATYETTSDGSYKFPPLDGTKNYKISANKSSYVFQGPDQKGNFLAHKLAEIIVKVIDQSNSQPLMGALVSLSGGESYRSNLQTDEAGSITFHSLSPSEYFLRPMMKEYIFEPSSKIIKIKDGDTLNVQLKGKRVAYSAFGKTISLNGEPEGGVIVVAIGTKNCSHYSEEAVSESNGHFRIRGLQPYCFYEIKVKSYLDQKHVLERTAPAVIHVDNVRDDVTELTIVVFRAASNTDILVHVTALNPDHYKTLRVKVSRETPPSVVHTIKVDVSNYKITKDYNTGILVQLPSVPLDGNTYIVQLESTLPQASRFESQVEYFTANSSFKFVRMEFIVKANLVDQHIKQTSIWTLIFIFALMFVIYNIDKVAGLFSEQLNRLNLFGSVVSSQKQKTATVEPLVDASEIDQIVQSINAVKRKPKSKKT